MSFFQRVVSKGSAEKFYLKVTIEFENPDTILNPVEFRALVSKAVRQLYGETGASIPVDVLRYQDITKEAILRVPGRSLVKCWSALTLLGEYAQESCAIRVNQVSPQLLALAVDSRHFFQDLPN
ncbi:ribonuclease P protein subunit p14-like [Acanthaster planci]|uniref:Ribonuclease P protein subunit p14-like n=1 Tax=Acanthaster planci TaxID=133434 RepID=A0A8B7ZH57_ACAPL|nr:ribonuclease P protein subunit p14-like [Acanthaster planci]XP_022104979.1 ribonuclease P protein subunit p14-like [Acanthaster planci]